jgi:predicted Zn-dependent protease
VLTVAVLAGVVVAGVAAPGTGAVTLLSVEQEIAVGREAQAEMCRRTKQVTDPVAVRYVRQLGARLARVAPGPRYPYSFTLADVAEVNAFSLPGGPVWVNRGVLQMAGTESQFASVVAHEVAHVALRHAASQATTVAMARWSLTVLGAMLGNAGGAGAAQVAGALLANGAVMTFSRDDEREADRLGATLLRRAGWNPAGMVEMFDRLAREEPQASGAATFFSTHPAPAERLENLRAPRTGGIRDTAAYRRVRARLERRHRLTPQKVH